MASQYLTIYIQGKETLDQLFEKENYRLFQPMFVLHFQGFVIFVQNGLKFAPERLEFGETLSISKRSGCCAVVDTKSLVKMTVLTLVDCGGENVISGCFVSSSVSRRYWLMSDNNGAEQWRLL